LELPALQHTTPLTGDQETHTHTPQYRWKAEDLSFCHFLLVWGVNLASLLKKASKLDISLEANDEQNIEKG
jgi:hypothetical protein